MITRFSSDGYARFWRSLIRFCHMGSGEAMTLVSLLCRANYDAYREYMEEERSCKSSDLDFEEIEAKPYETEIQLYKAMQALQQNIGEDQRTDTLRDAADKLRSLTNDLGEQFWRAYGVEIDDACTVFELCDADLKPDDEPCVCLLDEWLSLVVGDGGPVV